MKKTLVILVTTVVMLFGGVLYGVDLLPEEGFEGTFPPTGWVIYSDWDSNWRQNDGAYHTGSYCAEGIYSDGHNLWLITPGIDISGYSNQQLIYWEMLDHSLSGYETIVKISTDYSGSGDPDLASWTTLTSETPTGTWTEKTLDISSYTGTVYIAFFYYAGVMVISPWEVDDVKITGDAGSNPPDAPVATAATTDGTLTFYANWQASTGATGYYLDVATDAGFTTFLTGYENLDVSDVLTYSVTAGSAVDHYCRVRAYNGDGTSNNSNIITVSGSTLPVELSAFTATYNTTNGYTTLAWTTASETDVIGFNVYRSTSNHFDFAAKLNEDIIAGQGTTTEMNSYSFMDVDELCIGVTYYYWLESVEYSGINTVYTSIGLTPEEGNGGYEDIFEDESMLINCPNPVTTSTVISYCVNGTLRAEPVEINIYNMLGQLVDTIEGRYGTATWNTNGRSSGIYFYKLNTETYTEIKKMMVTK